jgi:hypothetical protein
MHPMEKLLLLLNLLKPLLAPSGAISHKTVLLDATAHTQEARQNIRRVQKVASCLMLLFRGGRLVLPRLVISQNAALARAVTRAR